MTQYRLIDISGISEEYAGDANFSLDGIPEVPHAYFNGYGPYERELEDVMIKVELSADKSEVIISKDGFPAHLNFDHYKDGLLEYAIHSDCLDRDYGSNCDSIMLIKRDKEGDTWRYAYED